MDTTRGDPKFYKRALPPSYHMVAILMFPPASTDRLCVDLTKLGFFMDKAPKTNTQSHNCNGCDLFSLGCQLSHGLLLISPSQWTLFTHWSCLQWSHSMSQAMAVDVLWCSAEILIKLRYSKQAQSQSNHVTQRAGFMVPAILSPNQRVAIKYSS